MKKLNICFFFIIFACFILYISANCTYDPKSSENGNNSSSNDNSSSASYTTKKWEPTAANSNVIEFYTNDPSWTTSAGASYWSPRSYKNASPALTTDEIEVKVSKVSGSSEYGYGIIFCIQADPDSGTFVPKNFYGVLITTLGYYRVIKFTGTEGSNVAPAQHFVTNWKYNSNIYKGQNVSNTIKVIITDPDLSTVPYFTIYFNDNAIDPFYDTAFDSTSLFSQEAGAYKYGFLVTLGPTADENFPDTAEDVTFEQLTPDYSTGSISASLSLSISGNKTININNSKLFFENSTLR